MHVLHRLSHYPPFVALLLSSLAFVVIATLREFGIIGWFELFSYDLLVRQRSTDQVANPAVLIVGITEKDIRRWGWPLNDELLASVIDKIAAHEPRTIGVDIYRDRSVPPGRDELIRALQTNENVIWGFKFGDETSIGIPPPQILMQTDRTGFVDIVQDPGGIIRRGLLFLDDGITVSYSLPLRLALRYLAVEGVYPQPSEENPWDVKLGPVTLPPLDAGFGGYIDVDFRGYQYMLDFQEGPHTFPVVSLAEITDDKVSSTVIRDKIVLIGITAESVKDYFYTPFSQGVQYGETMSGVSLLGHMASQLVRHGLAGAKPIRSLSREQTLLWTFVWSLAGGALVLFFRSPLIFSLAFGIMLVAYGAFAYGAFLRSWWLPVVPGYFSAILATGLVLFYLKNLEKRERTVLMRLFSSHVSKEVADEIWRQREEFFERGRPRPQRQVVTVLFSDIRGFTSISEKLDPQVLMEWLNAYMDVMAHVVAENGGVIDKFIGDAVMALFGIPVPRISEEQFRDDAINAVNCALAMSQAIDKLNIDLEEADLPAVRVRVGIFTGPVVVGSLGSSDRMQYTAIGDTVNTAARLEAYAKDSDVDVRESNCQIIVGGTTAEYLGSNFEKRPLGRASLRGKQQEIDVFQLTGKRKDHEGHGRSA